MKEKEEQRLGRNKLTAIDHTYIDGGKYRKKFNHITDNERLNRLIYKKAKEMLKHRSGTKFEDMCWIDLDTLEIIAEERNSKVEKKIEYSEATEKKIRKYDNLLTIHTHPDSFPPSIQDLNSNFEHKYEIGIVICHNGKIYMYSANEAINVNYYKLAVEDYLKNGYNEIEAQTMALKEIKEKFDVDFKEVTEYGNV